MKSLDIAYNVTRTFVESIPKKERKKYGQFFTSKKTTEFMASLFTIDYSKQELKLLDAGAGAGLLTVALVERLRMSGFRGKIKVVCYENDENVIPVLPKNLENIKNSFDIVYDVRVENYILSQQFTEMNLFQDTIEQYDLIIENPPYKKLVKDSLEAKSMAEICYGSPNLYFLFWAMGVRTLKEDKELVYIVPRSWTSGAYFELFRRYLFDHCVITNIHIFESRDKVFDGDSILQETIIVKVKKTRDKPKKDKRAT